MAEVAALTSILAIVEASCKLLSKGYAYLSCVKGAPQQSLQLLSELTLVNVILSGLSVEYDEKSLRHNEIFSRLRNRGGPLEQCDALVKEVAKLLQDAAPGNLSPEATDSAFTTHASSSPGENSASDKTSSAVIKAKNFARRLGWPFKVKRIEELIQKLKDTRKTLADAAAFDTLAAVKRIEDTTMYIQSSADRLESLGKKTQHGVQNLQEAQQVAGLRRWLMRAFTDSEENFQAAIGKRQAGTGKWLLGTDAFRSWLSGPPAMLWITGMAGSGKTVLSAVAIDFLKQLDEGIAVAYFYCDSRKEEKRTSLGLLSTVCTHLLGQTPGDLGQVYAQFSKQSDLFDHPPSKTDYISAMNALLPGFKKVYLVVDGADESSELDIFIKAVQEMATTSGLDGKKRTAHILMTSRNDVHIDRLFSYDYRIDLLNRTDYDVRSFVDIQVRKHASNPKIKKMAEEIYSKVVRKAKGNFLQARLLLDFLFPVKTIEGLKAGLDNLPNTLGSIYETILSRAVQDDPEATKELERMLPWLVMSKRSLTTLMLAEIAAISPQDTFLDDDHIYLDAEDLISKLGSLVVVDRSTDPPVVALAHASVEEYLQSQEIRQGPMRQFYIDPEVCNTMVGITCAQYLSFANFAKPVDASEVRLQLKEYNLLEYAANYWRSHLQGDEHARLAEKLNLSRDELFESHILPKIDWFIHPEKDSWGHYHSWEQVNRRPLDTDSRRRQAGPSRRIGAHSPPVYYVCKWGLMSCFKILQEKGVNVNDRLNNGWTPLTLAADNNWPDLVSELLKAGAVVDAPTSDFLRGRTALHCAAERGQLNLVRKLVEAGAEYDYPSTSGATPFYRAARQGSVPVMSYLYSLGANINVLAYSRWTPLMEAGERSNLAAYEALLGWGADATVVSDGGMTAADYLRVSQARMMNRGRHISFAT